MPLKYLYLSSKKFFDVLEKITLSKNFAYTYIYELTLGNSSTNDKKKTNLLIIFSLKCFLNTSNGNEQMKNCTS